MNKEFVAEAVLAAYAEGRLDQAENDAAIRADLLASLRFCVAYDGGECLGDHPVRLAAARAAIAAAEGTK